MAHNANDVLNLEPSRPEVRKENQLPPKTYADAVEENLESYGKKDFSTPVQYIGQGEDNAPRSPMRKAHKRNGSVRVNGTEKEKVDHKVPLERFEDADGKDLTSIRPTSNYKDALRQDEKEQKPLVRRNAKDELVSGRRAGAGWQRSGYAVSVFCNPC